jgi:hypothetical protein
VITHIAGVPAQGTNVNGTDDEGPSKEIHKTDAETQDREHVKSGSQGGSISS